MDERGSSRPPRRRVYRPEQYRGNHERGEYSEYQHNDYDEEDEGEYDVDYSPVPRRRSVPPRERPLPPREFPRSRPHSRSYEPPPRRPRRKKSVWPLLLTGCGLGIVLSVLGAAAVVFFALRAAQTGNTGLPNLPVIGGSHPFTKQDTQQVSLTTVAQIQVCDKVGNVSIAVNQQTTQPTVTVKKTVHAGSQADADQEFKRIIADVQPPQTIGNPLTCKRSPGSQGSNGTPTTQGNSVTSTPATSANTLTVNITFPQSDSLVHTDSDAVDISIALPPGVIPSGGAPMSVNVEAPVGNITLNGLVGLLNIRGGTGNVTVNGGALTDGSSLDTVQGNVTFNGLLELPADATATARYSIRSEQGNLDVTLPANTNLTLDANTNVGKISSEFPFSAKTASDGSASYHGPLNPSGSVAQNGPVLVTDVSTGNIYIHQAQVSS